MVVPRPGLAEATAIAIADVASNRSRMPTERRLNSMAQVGGALASQLEKRYGTDQLDRLDNNLVTLAYRQEVARIVRGWPAAGTWIGSTRFYGTAHLLRRTFARHGWSEQPGAMDNLLPSLLDLFLPKSVRRDDSQYLYVSNSFRKMIGGVSPSFFVKNKLEIGWLLDAESKRQAAYDRERMYAGDECPDVEYTTIIPGIDRITPIIGLTLTDDDGVEIGEFSMVADATKCSDEIRNLRNTMREGVLKVVGLFSVGSIALKFCIAWTLSLGMANMVSNLASAWS